MRHGFCHLSVVVSADAGYGAQAISHYLGTRQNPPSPPSSSPAT